MEKFGLVSGQGIHNYLLVVNSRLTVAAGFHVVVDTVAAGVHVVVDAVAVVLAGESEVVVVAPAATYAAVAAAAVAVCFAAAVHSGETVMIAVVVGAMLIVAAGFEQIADSVDLVC